MMWARSIWARAASSRRPCVVAGFALKAIAARAGQATKVAFNAGTDIASAVAAARAADVAIVFANQPASEGRDQDNISLPGNQDALIEAVAAANPRTIVVLETGGPVTMPWASQVAGVVEIWFPGSRGAEALGRASVRRCQFHRQAAGHLSRQRSATAAARHSRTCARQPYVL